MPVYNKRGILLLPKVIVLNPKDGHLILHICLITAGMGIHYLACFKTVFLIHVLPQ